MGGRYDAGCVNDGLNFKTRRGGCDFDMLTLNPGRRFLVAAQTLSRRGSCANDVGGSLCIFVSLILCDAVLGAFGGGCADGS